jgi:endonuclease-8
MPEGHTIHRIAKDLRRDLAGRPVAASSPQGRFAAGAARLDGRVPVRFEAYGKHLFAHWDAGDVLHVHLGLYGKFRPAPVPPPPPVGQVRLRLVGSETAHDLSGPTACELVTPGDRERILGRLGPDPLRRDADPERAWARVSRSRAPIGVVVLDQAVFAGVGNVFRAEALYVLGIHPEREARSLSRAEFDALWEAIRRMMREALRSNRIVTIDPAEFGLRRAAIDPADGRYVYRQEACRRCGTPVRRWDLRGRWAYACQSCQPVG